MLLVMIWAIGAMLVGTAAFATPALYAAATVAVAALVAGVLLRHRFTDNDAHQPRRAS
jgi:uncharacterized membrane protein